MNLEIISSQVLNLSMGILTGRDWKTYSLGNIFIPSVVELKSNVKVDFDIGIRPRYFMFFEFISTGKFSQFLGKGYNLKVTKSVFCWDFFCILNYLYIFEVHQVDKVWDCRKQTDQIFFLSFNVNIYIACAKGSIYRAKRREDRLVGRIYLKVHIENRDGLL